MKSHWTTACAVVGAVAVAAPASAAINIVFDYTYDNTNFFGNSAARDRLEQAAGFFETAFGDSLTAITPGGINNWSAVLSNPSTGALTTIDNLNIGANEIRVFVGARDMQPLGIGGPGGFSYSNVTSDFANTVSSRGQAGVSTNTDFGPWGGSLSFNSNIVVDVNGTPTSFDWHFGEDAPTNFYQFDFLSVAVHELGHLLGFGTADSWHSLVNSTGSGQTQTNVFLGSQAMNVFGGPVPLQSGQNPGHWADGLLDDSLTMDPILGNQSRVLLQPLDYAGFADMGWEVDPSLIPEPGTVLLLLAAGPMVLLRRRAA